MGRFTDPIEPKPTDKQILARMLDNANIEHVTTDEGIIVNDEYSELLVCFYFSKKGELCGMTQGTL